MLIVNLQYLLYHQASITTKSRGNIRHSHTTLQILLTYKGRSILKNHGYSKIPPLSQANSQPDLKNFWVFLLRSFPLGLKSQIEWLRIFSPQWSNWLKGKGPNTCFQSERIHIYPKYFWFRKKLIHQEFGKKRRRYVMEKHNKKIWMTKTKLPLHIDS